MCPQKIGLAICNWNQQPKFGAKRNHPSVVQGSTCSIYFGANSDIQRHICSNLGEYLIRALVKGHYPPFFQYLDCYNPEDYSNIPVNIQLLNT